MQVKRYYDINKETYNYHVDYQYYPSVSTILRSTKDLSFESYIQEWQEKLIEDFGEKVGIRKANISKEIGNYTHKVIEKQLKAFPSVTKEFQRSLAKHYQPIINQIAEVIAVELPVYSAIYGYAGTIDAIVKLKDGRTVILDHKTSNKKKTRSGIKDYFLQVAAYAIAYHDMTGIKVDSCFVNIIYRQKRGIRKPTRFDSYEIGNLRLECLNFFKRLDRYRLIQIENQEEELPW